MPNHISKDARKVRTFNIQPYTKGFTSDFTEDGIVTNEFFQFKEIYQIIHHPDVCVEIVNYSGQRRVFYNDTPGESKILFDILNDTMTSWLGSNLN